MVYLALFILGLCVGSFLNVIVYRLDRGGLLWGRSQCMSCEMVLTARELVPVVSFVALHGRCRSCNVPISWQYPLVEFATGFLFALAGYQVGIAPSLVGVCAVISALVVIFVYDLKFKLIPDTVSIPAFGIALITSLVRTEQWESLAYGIALGTGFFALQFFISRGRWVGGGDIRLGAVMGALLGWPHTAVALVLAYLIGAVAGVFLLATGVKRRGDEVPFGPFLVIATIVTLFWGSTILDAYIGLFR